jgi:DNA-binding HxlR family transcriptional regulator
LIVAAATTSSPKISPQYSLTEVGVGLNTALAPLGDWGEQRLAQLGVRQTQAETRPDRIRR